MGYQPEKIIMFGSMARGEADEYSDIDLIVVKETSQRFIQRQVDAISFVYQEIRPNEIKVDIFVYTPKEFRSMVEGGNPFMERALAEGIVLYENSAGNRPALVGPG